MALSTQDVAFLSEVEALVTTPGEILVEIRYSRAAGSRDWMLMQSFPQFQEKLRTLPAPTAVTVYRRYELPMRGIVTEEFIQSALNLLPDGAEYLVVYLHPRDDWRLAKEYAQGPGWLHSHIEGQGHTELEGDLRETLGEEAAIGLYPDYRPESNNDLTAYVPNADGSVTIGVY